MSFFKKLLSSDGSSSSSRTVVYDKSIESAVGNKAGNDNNNNKVVNRQQYNIQLIQLALSRNNARVVSLNVPSPPLFQNKVSTADFSDTPLKLTLFNGYTNGALFARYNKSSDICIKPSALVYCSAGMLFGQLSNPGGVHIAQEEGTVLENPLMAMTLNQALIDHHSDCTERTEYPQFTQNEAEKRSTAQQHVITPAYGFAIDNVVPLYLDGNNLASGFSTPGWRKNGESTIAYIMQAAIHLGLTHEDEGTNFMYFTNQYIQNIVNVAKSKLNDKMITPYQYHEFTVDLFHALRNIAQYSTSYYPRKECTEILNNKILHIPLDEDNGAGGAFDAFNDGYDRQSLRIAIKTMLFADINPESILTVTWHDKNNNKDNNNKKSKVWELKCQRDQSSTATFANTLYKTWCNQFQTINQKYRDAVKFQLTNQLKLTKQIQSDVFITGMYGCGVYNNDWRELAQVYGEVLKDKSLSGHLREVVICNAITSENKDGMSKFVQTIYDTMTH